MVKVLIKKLNPAVKLPEYKTNGASGMDIIAFIDKPVGTKKDVLDLTVTEDLMKAIKSIPDAPDVL